MHPRILAQRTSIAVDRMVKAAPVVAERFGVAEEVSTVHAKDPAIRQMLRNEAVADLLDRLMQADGATGIDVNAVVAALEGAEGIGPKTLELIRNALKGDD